MQWELIKIRKQHQLNQKDMADLLGLSVTGYRNKETGVTKFDSDEMFIIAKHFRMKIEDIFLPKEYAIRVQKESERI